MLTWGRHNHPPPRRTKTPPIHAEFLDDYLRELDWKIATITPRSLNTNAVVISRLRKDLQWAEQDSPSLADLHPSLSNFDHVGSFVSARRDYQFPSGTDWEGAKFLLQNQLDKTLEGDPNVYIRSIVETDEYKFIILMLPAQSEWLSKARYATMDVSFKRVQSWKEFGIESWSTSTDRCESLGVLFASGLTNRSL